MPRARTGTSRRKLPAPGPSTFEVFDPKRRTIVASHFRDQVVHHALIGALEPVFERRMIFDSYACRAGKGTHRALARARRFVRLFGYFLKMDVASFFASVRHSTVMETLARVLKDRRVLDLCATVLRAEPGGVGLPVGSLTSQWFANLLLDRLDHFVKEKLRLPGYVRYMDDFVMFSDFRDGLHAAQDAVTRFLADPLRLVPKPAATLLAPTTQGLPFLGWLLFRGTTRLRPANLRRYRWRMRLRRWQLARGHRTRESFRQGVASIHELLRHGDTRALRRRWCEEDPMELQQRGQAQRAPGTASTAAGAGTTLRRTRDPRTGTGTPRATGTTRSASAPPIRRTARSAASAPCKWGDPAAVQVTARARLPFRAFAMPGNRTATAGGSRERFRTSRRDRARAENPATSPDTLD